MNMRKLKLITTCVLILSQMVLANDESVLDKDAISTVLNQSGIDHRYDSISSFRIHSRAYTAGKRT